VIHFVHAAVGTAGWRGKCAAAAAAAAFGMEWMLGLWLPSAMGAQSRGCSLQDWYRYTCTVGYQPVREVK